MTQIYPEPDGVEQQPAPLWAKIAATVGLLTAVLLVGSIAVYGIMWGWARLRGVDL